MNEEARRRTHSVTSLATSRTGKKAAIRRTAVRETDVFRHNGGPTNDLP